MATIAEIIDLEVVKKLQELKAKLKKEEEVCRKAVGGENDGK